MVFSETDGCEVVDVVSARDESAVRILATGDARLAERLERFQESLAETALSKNAALAAKLRTLPE